VAKKDIFLGKEEERPPKPPKPQNESILPIKCFRIARSSILLGFANKKYASCVLEDFFDFSILGQYVLGTICPIVVP
jgi:hypothetical protein